MLSNVRKKMIQKGIKKYSEIQIENWWNINVGPHIFKYSNSGNQRYSKEKIKASFENPSLAQGKIPYYKVGNETYNMIFCPSGVFIKGINNFQHSNPREKMKIEKAFLLGETEITQEIYEAVMGVNPSEFQGQDNGKNPVEQVSWYDALIFCNKLSDMFKLDRYYTFGDAQELKDGESQLRTYYPIAMNENAKGFRLPTEWEWEYAAKAGTQLGFSGSNDHYDVAWTGYKLLDPIEKQRTIQVKNLKPNAWGFYDMSGNVEEWCEGEREPTRISDHRPIRGGNWKDQYAITLRYRKDPNRCDKRLGFRVCRYI